MMNDFDPYTVLEEHDEQIRLLIDAHNTIDSKLYTFVNNYNCLVRQVRKLEAELNAIKQTSKNNSQ